MDQQNPEADGIKKIQNLVIFPLKEYYESGIEDSLDYMKFIGEENKIFQRIRENFSHNWKIVELCRESLFDNVKRIQSLREGIENDREAIKKLG